MENERIRIAADLETKLKEEIAAAFGADIYRSALEAFHTQKFPPRFDRTIRFMVSQTVTAVQCGLWKEAAANMIRVGIVLHRESE